MLINFRWIFFVWIFSFFICKNISIRARNYQLTGIECLSYDLSFVNFSQCELDKTKKSRHVINAIANALVKTVSLKIRFKLSRKVGNRFESVIDDSWLDICALLAQATSKYNIFWELWASELRKHTNINRTCPYEPQPIVAKDLTLDEDFVKFLPFPKGVYRLEMVWVANEARRALVTIHCKFS